MNDYQTEQLEALTLIRRHLPGIRADLQSALGESLADYSAFRRETDRFLDDYFAGHCSLSCYQNKLSACCSKDGIVTFFADAVINAMYSNEPDLDQMEDRLRGSAESFKCIYLSSRGCLWAIKPIVCQMFLCDQSQKEVFAKNAPAQNQWLGLKQKTKDFTWPSKPILFDQIESIFLDAGWSSSLMYLHNSPGLLQVKRKAGLLKPG